VNLVLDLIVFNPDMRFWLWMSSQYYLYILLNGGRYGG